MLIPKAGSRFKGQEWQVIQINYSSRKSLIYTLKGVDLVISTVHSSAQLELIDAAVEAGVKHFIPSSFSGPFQCCPLQWPNLLWKQTLEKLRLYEQKESMRYTIISCGIFYERFGPGGLETLSISSEDSPHQAICGEGAYLVDSKLGIASVPLTSDHKESVYLCMTSARDAARYLVAALRVQQDLTLWPHEFVYYTERLSVLDLVNICANVHGKYVPCTRFGSIFRSLTQRATVLLRQHQVEFRHSLCAYPRHCETQHPS